MSTTTHLYILVFPEKRVIKIGKANDIQNRIDSLKRWWGEVDYAASYYLQVKAESVYGLEKSLHFMLSGQAMEFDDGDGRTELFSIDTLDHALKHIELYLSLNTNASPLQKGILRPIKQEQPQHRPARYEKIKKKSEKFFTCLASCNAKFEKINRLIVFLMRRQSRIQFQYDIIDDYIYFRIRHNRSTDAEMSLSVMSLLGFKIHDFDGWFGVNCCTAVEIGDVVQYKIRLIKPLEDRSAHPYLAYMSTQVERVLRQLPQRSSATTEEIPIINENEVFADLLSCVAEQ